MPSCMATRHPQHRTEPQIAAWYSCSSLPSGPTCRTRWHMPCTAPGRPGTSAQPPVPTTLCGPCQQPLLLWCTIPAPPWWSSPCAPCSSELQLAAWPGAVTAPGQHSGLCIRCACSAWPRLHSQGPLSQSLTGYLASYVTPTSCSPRACRACRFAACRAKNLLWDTECDQLELPVSARTAASCLPTLLSLATSS